jgi:hypothetical protein
MRHFINTVALSLSLVLATGAAARADKPVPARAGKVKIDLKKVEQHLRQHQQYPATRAELIASCNNLIDFEDGEKKWFAASLPDGTYQSADEVMKALQKAR